MKNKILFLMLIPVLSGFIDLLITLWGGNLGIKEGNALVANEYGFLNISVAFIWILSYPLIIFVTNKINDVLSFVISVTITIAHFIAVSFWVNVIFSILDINKLIGVFALSFIVWVYIIGYILATHFDMDKKY